MIQKGHTRRYESDLKKEFKSWADSREVTKVKTNLFGFLCFVRSNHAQKQREKYAIMKRSTHFAGYRLNCLCVLNKIITFFCQVQSVINSLNSVFLENHSLTGEQWGELGMTLSGKGFIKRNFAKLIDELRAQDKLPALVFR